MLLQQRRPQALQPQAYSIVHPVTAVNVLKTACSSCCSAVQSIQCSCSYSEVPLPQCTLNACPSSQRQLLLLLLTCQTAILANSCNAPSHAACELVLGYMESLHRVQIMAHCLHVALLCSVCTYPQQHVQPAQGEALKHTSAWLQLQLLLPLGFCTLQGTPADLTVCRWAS
jgi:hypothetical protein